MKKKKREMGKDWTCGAMVKKEFKMIPEYKDLQNRKDF